MHCSTTSAHPHWGDAPANDRSSERILSLTLLRPLSCDRGSNSNSDPERLSTMMAQTDRDA